MRIGVLAHLDDGVPRKIEKKRAGELYPMPHKSPVSAHHSVAPLHPRVRPSLRQQYVPYAVSDGNPANHCEEYQKEHSRTTGSKRVNTNKKRCDKKASRIGLPTMRYSEPFSTALPTWGRNTCKKTRIVLGNTNKKRCDKNTSRIGPPRMRYSEPFSTALPIWGRNTCRKTRIVLGLENGSRAPVRPSLLTSVPL